MPIVQGSNNPLVIKFDAPVDEIPTLIITLWRDMPGLGAANIKKWETADMLINGDTAVCQMTERETRELPPAPLMLEAKGLDANGNTVFWDEYRVDVKRRRDKVIRLTQTGG